MIFEKSLEFGEVPADWKQVNIVPVFKKIKKEDPRNYRPVSIPSLPSKVKEKIILGGKPADVIFLDFSKAFYTVSHRILLDKVSSTQLDKHIMWWESNWLTGQAQRIFIKDLDVALDSILSQSADDTIFRDAADFLKIEKLEYGAITNHVKFNKGFYIWNGTTLDICIEWGMRHWKAWPQKRT
ncbi:hypothetical protein BTVI_10854 [Pitangus sulphuratus]|nr:hypothetical protein BTVI_10854 [Pitangus sulphuratus]